LRPKKVLNEKEYYYLTKKYSNAFEAETGSDPILTFLKEIDLPKEVSSLEERLNKIPHTQKSKALKRLKILKSFIKSNTKPE
jgi:DNA-directed RNA polymerase beta' subunit